MPVDRASLLALLVKAGYRPSLIEGAARRIAKRLAELEDRAGRPARKREVTKAIAWDLRNAGTVHICVRPAARAMLVRRVRELARLEGQVDMVELATEILLEGLGGEGKRGNARKVSIPLARGALPGRSPGGMP